MESDETEFHIIDRTGRVALEFRGNKAAAAEQIVAWIAERLVKQ
jgi:hypothetical protein